MKFIDEVTLAVASGAGGNGAVAFRRERFRPKGGPAGGDGGNGGDVVLKADRNVGTLLDLHHRPRLEAKRGEDGGGRDCHGRGASPLVVRVPVGTAVHDADECALLGDLVIDGQELVVARGGRGGRGNIRFVTPSNQAPRTAEPGGPGEKRNVRLELRLLADVGLVGLPNAGKSTLVSRLSAARPRIADYPFTTLVPNLGVVEIAPGETFVMADIPGLVRGAADGVGLGHRFLRHVQRTAVLVFLVSPDETGENDLLGDLQTLLDEVSAFDADLARRPRLVVVGKRDLPAAPGAIERLREALVEEAGEPAEISAVTGAGLPELVRRLHGMVLAHRGGGITDPEDQ
jgi:GTP-binding protein